LMVCTLFASDASRPLAMRKRSGQQSSNFSISLDQSEMVEIPVLSVSGISLPILDGSPLKLSFKLVIF